MPYTIYGMTKHIKGVKPKRKKDQAVDTNRNEVTKSMGARHADRYISDQSIIDMMALYKKWLKGSTVTDNIKE